MKAASVLPCLVLLFLLAQCEGKGKGKGKSKNSKVKSFDGKTIETSTLPLVYACPKKYGYILLGGITFNATDVSAENQSLAVSQCDAQLEDKSLQKGKQTKCEVSFSKNTTIEQTGIIRAVFKCLSIKGSGNGKWEVITDNELLTAKSTGKKIKLSCTGADEIIEIQSVTRNGVLDEETAVTEFRGMVQRECFEQAINAIKKNNGNKAAVLCDYGLASSKTKIDVTYYCIAPEKTEAAPLQFMTV